LTGLTFSLALFVFYIVLPGNLALLVAGRSKKERGLSYSLVVGSIVFCANLLAVFLISSVTKFGLFTRFLGLLEHSSRGFSQELDASILTITILLGFIIAAVAGWCELAIVTGTDWLVKVWVYLVKRRAKKTARFQIKPGDLLLNVLIGYRVSGIQPALSLTFKDDQKLVGELVKYSWNGRESLLIRRKGDPQSMVWVDLSEVKALEFLHEAGQPEIGASARLVLTPQQKLFYDVAVWPGYGDIVEQELRAMRN